MDESDADWDVPVGVKKKKPWGYERPIAKFRDIFLKELFLLQGKTGSLHYHEEKDEMFYLIRGQLRVLLNDKEVKMNPGDTLRILPGQHHRIIPLKDSLLLEIGTRMFGDVIRIADEYQRPNRE